jgi:hypothetical protein
MKRMEKVVVGVIFPVIVGVAIFWLTHSPPTAVPSVAPLGWVAIAALLLAAGMVSVGMVAIAVIEGGFPAPALVLIGVAGIGSAFGSAIDCEAGDRPLPAIILLGLSGILMLAYGLGCYFRDQLFGTYSGLVAALCATLLVITWEAGSDRGFVKSDGNASDIAQSFHLAYALVVTLGVTLSTRYRWIAALVLCVLLFALAASKG